MEITGKITIVFLPKGVSGEGYLLIWRFSYMLIFI